MSQKIENARENLLDKGRKILFSTGYDSLNIKTLARDCGMASGTFYQYFHNKDDLVMQVIYESCEIIPENIRKISSNNWKLSRKLKYVYEQFRRFQKSYSAMKIGVLRLSEDYERLRARVMTEINASVEELLNNEIIRGRLELHADPAMAAFLLTHLLFSIGRDADPDFEEIWKCMNFRVADTAEQTASSRPGGPA